MSNPTFEELSASLPEAAVESTCSGEVVVYTGWMLDPDDPTAPMVEWVDPEDEA
jgi:hypothetical protein